MNKGPNINLSTDAIAAQLKYVKTFFARYGVLLFFVANIALYSFIIWQIGALNSVAADQESVDEKLQSGFRLKIDQDSVNKIQQLQDQNIAVQSLFKSARENPFQE